MVNWVINIFDVLDFVVVFIISVDDELIRGVLSISEGVALRLVNEEGNVEACLQWYEVLVQFANRHGIKKSGINFACCIRT